MKVNKPKLDKEMEDELIEAKKTLKGLIIEEKGEDYYYDLIVERIKWIDDLKRKCNNIFGEDDERFREEVRSVIANTDDDEEFKLYNFVITEIAMDTLID